MKKKKMGEWVPVASTVNVKKWQQQMRAVDGLIYGLARIFGWEDEND